LTLAVGNVVLPLWGYNFGPTPLLDNYTSGSALGCELNLASGLELSFLLDSLSLDSSVEPSSSSTVPCNVGTSSTAPSANSLSPHVASHCSAAYTNSKTPTPRRPPTSVSLSETDYSCPPTPHVLVKNTSNSTPNPHSGSVSSCRKIYPTSPPIFLTHFSAPMDQSSATLDHLLGYSRMSKRSECDEPSPVSSTSFLNQ
jgi:hypothetical protein